MSERKEERRKGEREEGRKGGREEGRKGGGKGIRVYSDVCGGKPAGWTAAVLAPLLVHSRTCPLVLKKMVNGDW